jgi:dTMP kinase
MTASDLKSKLAGKFIVFDGPDGSGKGTQIKLLTERLEREGITVENAIDPGGTRIGGQIRSILLDHDLSDMDFRCETLLFMASRAQLIHEVINPAIKAGKVVICDRFISATCAYQGAAGSELEKIIELGRFAVGNSWPDLTLIVDVPAEVGFKRIEREHDAMESRPIEFHRKVHDIFVNLPTSYPSQVEIIDGTESPEAVHERILEVLKRVDL